MKNASLYTKCGRIVAVPAISATPFAKRQAEVDITAAVNAAAVRESRRFTRACVAKLLLAAGALIAATAIRGHMP